MWLAASHRGISVILKNALGIRPGLERQTDPDRHVNSRIHPAADARDLPKAVCSPVDDRFVTRFQGGFAKLHLASDR
jgi:hypothetical protein